MKKTMVIIMVLVVILTTALTANADVYVRGYHRSNGTYVQPHYRSNPDGIRSNNWSTYPNVNPHTGKRGTRRYSTLDLPNTGFAKNKPNALPCYPSMVHGNSPL